MSDFLREAIVEENIKWFEQQLTTSNDGGERRLLQEMLNAERQKLMPAIAESSRPVQTACRLS
jgi:tRNA(Ile)-lysidine synthase TilS/MesJ